MPDRPEPTTDDAALDAGAEADLDAEIDAEIDAHIDPASDQERDEDTEDTDAVSDTKARAARRQMREPKPGSRMTEQEQQWGKWLGLISAAGFGVLAQPWLGGEHLAQAGLGVAMGMLLWSVARQGFRIRTAIASYLFLFAFGDLFLFGALHIGYAFLLAFRASREMGQARAEDRARGRKAQPAAEKQKPEGRRKKKGSGDDTVSPPPLRVTEANRRYTPPKPKRKRKR